MADDITTNSATVTYCPGALPEAGCGKTVEPGDTHCESCAMDLKRDREIAILHGELETSLASAAAEIRKASSALSSLVSNAVYDIEYAEGREGEDMARELKAAARALCNADRIHKLHAAICAPN